MRSAQLTRPDVRMNPDLSMGEDCSRRPRTGNLFTISASPTSTSAGLGRASSRSRSAPRHLQPTNGEVVPQSTADIACWFIDTAYDNLQFFVRHAYFLGDDDPYDKLRSALRADIDEAAWSSLNSTTSRPFPVPGLRLHRDQGDQPLRRRDPQGVTGSDLATKPNYLARVWHARAA